MEKFKQKMIQRFVEYGKRHRKLKAPVIAILAVCLMTYYMVREAGHKLLRNRFRRRLVCVMMAAVILLTQTEITGVFALAQDSDTAAAAIAGFEELPDEVREQTVSVGTAIDELVLPSELIAYIAVETEENGEAPEESGAEENGETPEESAEAPEESAEAPEESSTGENAEVSREDGTEENTEDSEENSILENTTGEAVENPAETGADTTVETVTVELPEYYAEPDKQTVSVLCKSDDAGDLPEVENIRQFPVAEVSVTWQSAPEYDKDTAGEYVFTPILPDGYTLAEGVNAPKITVTVADMDEAVRMLLERLDKLSDNPESYYEDYLEKEPLEDDYESYGEWEEAFYAWMETLYAVVEEALFLWDEYEALTVEQRAQIPQEALDKLTAWKEFAEGITGDSMVMLAAATSISGSITDNQTWNDGDTVDETVTISGGREESPIVITISGTVTVNAQITISGCVKFTGSGTLQRGGESFHIFSLSDSAASLTIDGVTIDGNNVSCSGYRAVYLTAGSVTMNSGAIQNCVNTSGSGSAAYISGGTFTINDGTVKDNQSSSYGGVFYVYGGELIINGGTFQNNSTTDSYPYGGGCIYNRKTVTISGGTFTGNSSTRGGAVYNSSYGTLTMTGGNFSGNTATETDGTYLYGNGIFHSSRTSSASGSILNISGNVNMADQIYLDATSSDKKIYVTSALKYPITVVMSDESATEDRIIAEGSGYTLTGQDMSRLSIINDGWYFKLSENQILLTQAQQYFDVSVIGADPGHTVVVGEVTLDDKENGTYTGQVEAGTYDVLLDGFKVGSITVSSDGTNTFEVSTSFTVTFDANGGTCGMVNKTVTKGSTYGDLPTPTRTGYAFDGWYTENTGGTQVTSATTVTLTAAHTLYAHWQANTYTVTYDGNGSTEGSTSSSSHTYDTAKDLTANGFTRSYTVTFNHNYTGSSNTYKTANYTFAGWNTSSAGTGTDYADMASVINLTAANNGTFTLYAKWISASVTYQPSQAGYSFGGWYTDESCTGTRADSNGTYTPSANVTLYAKWTANTYTVTYNKNSGTIANEGSYTNYTYGTALTLPTPVRTGYTFGGWYENANCTGTKVTEIPATAVGNKEYWAKWTDNIAPIIGSLQYSYAPKNFWHWLIGRDSLIITVPVTEEGSGADQITYVVTPESGTALTKTSSIADGEAKITVSADFKGTIVISCTDKTGNTSASVTVGKDLDENANGIIIEDDPPQIAFEANGSITMGNDEYETAPSITVTVTDDKDNAISAGIASVNYSVGNGGEIVNHNYTTSMIVNDSFIIPASEIPAGETVISVTAVDNAGNSITEKYTVKVHTHSVTFVPAVEPTCTEAGTREHYTCTCGKYFEDNGCTKEITNLSEAALGHDFSAEYSTDKEATCTEAGSKSQHCSRCDARQNITAIEAKGHSFGDWHKDGERHWKECSRCGVKDTALGHRYDNDRDEDCNDCGYKRTIDNPDNRPPEDENKPDNGDSQPPEPDNGDSQPLEPDNRDNQTGTKPSPDDTKQPETDKEPGTETPKPTEKPDETGTQPDRSETQTVPAKVDEEKQEITGEKVTTGTVPEAGATQTVLSVGEGAVIVTVVCEEEKIAAGVADTIAVANAVLTSEQIQLVNDGENIEIRVDVKDISVSVEALEKQIVEAGMEEYRKEMPDLQLGMYVDISMFIRVGVGDWNNVTKTDEPIEVVISIPEELRESGRKYYVVRSHDGETTLFYDMDDTEDTITISTELFSTYAIAYEEGTAKTDTGRKCRLCHICPTFLGICYFIWLAVIILTVLVIIWLLHRKKKRDEESTKTES